MENREFTIHGPNLTEANKQEVNEFISGYNIDAQEAVEGEMEKSPEFEQAILEINQYREEIAAELGLPKPVTIVSAQIHLLPPELFKQRYPNYSDDAWGNHENLGDGIFIKYHTESQDRDMLKMILLHEGIHIDSYRAFFTKNENGQPIDSLSGETRSGYTTRKPKKEKEYEHLNAFNEAVVQKIAWEKICSHTPSIKDNPSYIQEVRILNAIIRRLASQNSGGKEEAWGEIKKGLFTGEMMHLRKIVKVYGPNSLKILANLDTEDSNITDKTLNYFMTLDSRQRVELEKELLSNSK